MDIKIDNNKFMESFHDYILGFDKLDEQTRQVYLAIADLTSDIDKLWEKDWLIIAVTSHLYTGVFKEAYRREFVERCVIRYFNLLNDRYITATDFDGSKHD